MDYIATSRMKKMGITPIAPPKKTVPNALQTIEYVFSNLSAALVRGTEDLSPTTPVFSCYIDKTKQGFPLTEEEMIQVRNTVTSELKNHFTTEVSASPGGVLLKIFLQ